MADTAISPASARLELTTRRPEYINLSALTAARSGVARSGITRSGYTAATITEAPTFLDVMIHDDQRIQNVDTDGWRFRLVTGAESSTASMTVIPRGQFTVEKAQDLVVTQGGHGVGPIVFCGHILNVSESIQRASHELEYRIEAVDHHWLLDRFSLVSASYGDRGINTIIADILANFVDPSSGFTKGYVPSSLGNATISFDNVRVSQALTRLVETVDGAIWTVDHQKRVSAFVDPDDEGNTISVVDDGDWRHFSRFQDVTQAINRVVFIGGGSVLTTTAKEGDTTLAVEELGWYDPTGGSVRGGNQTVTYTGKSAGSGSGTLTGVTGITGDIPQGFKLYNLSQADDTDAQTELAALLGGGQSGVSVHLDSDHRFGYERTAQAAASLLTVLKTPNVQIEYDVMETDDTTHGEIRPGRNLTLGLTKPEAMAGSFRIRQVDLRPHTRRSDGTLKWARHVTASQTRRTLVRVLEDALEWGFADHETD